MAVKLAGALFLWWFVMSNSTGLVSATNLYGPYQAQRNCRDAALKWLDGPATRCRV